MRRRASIGWLAAALLVLAGLLLVNPARREIRADQPRFEQPSLVLMPGDAVQQSFLADKPNLSAIDVTLVRYERDKLIPEDASFTLTLKRIEPPGVVSQRSWSVQELKHNDVLRLEFTPELDSAGQAYLLTASSNADAGIALWQSSGDAYSDGEGSGGGDLRFSTEYRYTLHNMLSDLASQLGRWTTALPALLATLFIPGLAVMPWLLPRRRLAWPEWLLGALMASMALIALAFLWAALLGLPLNGWLGAAAAVGLFLAGVWGWRSRARLLAGISRRETSAAEWLLVVVLVLSVATRLLQVRDLLVPNWVDGVHHTMLTQLLMERGYVPASYEPYMPIGSLHYHFGLHTSAAVCAWLGVLRANQAVLLVGQAVSAFVPLAMYVLAAALTHRRTAGLAAAAIAGCGYYMPSYFASWGRYTHLLGLLLLCGVVAQYWRLFSLGEANRREICWVALVSAGLALCHYRASILAALLILILWLISRLRTRLASGWTLLRLLAPPLVAAILIAPWIYRFAAEVIPQVGSVYGGWEVLPGYNVFPDRLLSDLPSRVLIAASALALVAALLRRQRVMLGVGIWACVCMLLANLRLLGLSDLWMLPNSVMVISWWVPASVLCGWLAAELLEAAEYACTWLRARKPAPVRRTGHIAMPALVIAFLAALLWGSWRLVDTVNPSTVLVKRDDIAAMRWITANTPADALFLVNSIAWSGQLHAGSDAGWWIPYLAGRRASMPPLLHSQGDQVYFRQVRDLAAAVEALSSPDAPELLTMLRDAGITHVYIGAAGGPLKAAALDISPHYELLYSDGPTRVYALKAE